MIFSVFIVKGSKRGLKLSHHVMPTEVKAATPRKDFAYFLLLVWIVAIDLQRITLLLQATTNLPFPFKFLSFFSFSCLSPPARTSLCLLCLQKMLPRLTFSLGTYPWCSLHRQCRMPLNLGQHGSFWRCMELFARPELRCCWLSGSPGRPGMMVLPWHKTSLSAFGHPGLAVLQRHSWRNAPLPVVGRRGTVAR